MSYARKGLDGSHVYVFGDGKRLHCHECSLDPTGGHFISHSPDAMLGHLARHVAIGEVVPAAAIARLVREAGFSFALGELAVTPGVRAAGIPVGMLTGFIRRHMGCDFGELDAHDVAANHDAIAHGLRVLSAYSHGDVKIFVITEADRSRTTLLLASEY